MSGSDAGDRDEIEAAAKAGYETLAGELTGQNGPEQQRYPFTVWDGLKHPYIKEAWRMAARAVLYASRDFKATAAGVAAKKSSEPIDLAKHSRLK